MKPFIIKGSFIFSICFFPFCSTLDKREGSLTRQVELVRDLETKLPKEDQSRFHAFLDNIKEEDKRSDNTIKRVTEQAKEAQETALDKSEDAGKWFGVRNVFIALISAVLLYFGFVVGKKFLEKSSLPSSL